MSKILVNNTGNEVEIPDTGKFVPANGQLTIDPNWFALFGASDDIVELVGNGTISVSDGSTILSLSDSMSLMKGMFPSLELAINDIGLNTFNEANRFKVAVQPDPHHTQHESGGGDEIDATGLSGLLADEQHPIAQECKDAMGTKSVTNPYHHDRYQQSEISNLPETQLSLNHATHDNSNDPSTVQKQAMENANSPATGNPFATMNDLGVWNVTANFNTLPATPPINQVWKTLEDYVDGDTYEAGWYSYLGDGTGIYGSDWKFYSSTEGSSSKRTAQLVLVCDGSTSYNWMKINDTKIKSNESGWTPPFNCKVREVVYSNKYGGSSGQSVELKSLYRSRSDTNYFSTSDPVEWSCGNSGTNLIYNEGNGKRWGYDCTIENKEMLLSRAYAFRINRNSGSKNMDDIHITIMLEEV